MSQCTLGSLGRQLAVHQHELEPYLAIRTLKSIARTSILIQRHISQTHRTLNHHSLPPDQNNGVPSERLADRIDFFDVEDKVVPLEEPGD